MSPTERTERDRLEGPWQRTAYELYEWLSPLANLTRGTAQDEMVGREVLASEAGACLGIAQSALSGCWPRDPFLLGVSAYTCMPHGTPLMTIHDKC